MIKSNAFVLKSFAFAAALGLSMSAAQADEKLKIGVIATLSGPAAVIGQQVRNGFALGVKNLGGKLGGREVEVIVANSEGKPDVAVGKVKALVDRDKVDFVVGPVFSNVLGAIMKPVTEANVILISPNAGSSAFAGKNCNPNFFVTSYENDQVHEVSGQYAQDSGIKTVIIIVRELSGRQRRRTGLQGQIPRQSPRRNLCAARPARLLGRDRQDRRGKSRSDLRLRAGRHGRELRQAIPASWSCRQDHVPVGVHGRRGGASSRKRRRAWHVWGRQLGAEPGQSAEQGVRRRIFERIQYHPGNLRVPGLRHRVADR